MSAVGQYTGAAIPARATAESGFTVGDLFAVISARKSLILKVALAAMVATAGVLLAMPTVWWTSAVVTLDTQKNNITDQSAVLSALPTDPASLQNQLQILSSRDLAAEVIGKLKLYDDPEFNGRLRPSLLQALGFSEAAPADPLRERDEVISAFLGKLSVDPLGLSTSIAVGFTARDPAKAAAIVNAVVDTYVADQVRTKREETDRTAAWLNARLKELGDQAQAASDAAQKFKTEHNLAEAADGTPLIDQQIAAMSTQLVQARADLAQKQAAFGRISAFGDGSDAAQLSQVVASPLIVQLRSQEADLIKSEAELSDRYGPRHPKMIALEAQRRDLDEKIKAEVNRIGASLGSDVAVSRAQIGSLAGSLAGAERQAANQNAAWAQLKALEANAASARDTYNSFLARLRATQGQDDIQTADAHVISHAAVPDTPSAPKRTLIVLASIPAGLLLGVLAALLAERFSAPPASPPTRARFPSPSPMRPAPQPAPAAAPMAVAAPLVAAPPVLAPIPNASDSRAADYVIDWPRSQFAMTVTNLVGRLIDSGTTRVVAVTAADPRDGKTSVAVAFARAAALGGRKAVVIDGDLRRPVTAVAMGLAPALTGMAEVLAGRVALSRALLMDPRSNAFVLSCAKPLKDPAVVWSSQQYAQLLAHLKKTCDLIVIDAPPAQTPEAKLIARSADAVVMVVARDRAHQPQIANAVYDMARQAVPLGVALTG